MIGAARVGSMGDSVLRLRFVFVSGLSLLCGESSLADDAAGLHLEPRQRTGRDGVDLDAEQQFVADGPADALRRARGRRRPTGSTSIRRSASGPV